MSEYWGIPGPEPLDAGDPIVMGRCLYCDDELYPGDTVYAGLDEGGNNGYVHEDCMRDYLEELEGDGADFDDVKAEAEAMDFMRIVLEFEPPEPLYERERW